MISSWTGNKIGVEGAMKISESLMKNTTLTQLDLGCDGKNNTNETHTKWQ